MPKRSLKQPTRATVITTYDQLQELVGCFASGQIPLLVVTGRPGLSKTQSIKGAVKDNKSVLLVSGRRSPIDFFASLY